MINLSNYRKNIYHKYGVRECPYYSEDGVIMKIFEKIGVQERDKLIIEFGETRALGTTTRSFRIKYKSPALYFTQTIDLYSKILNALDIIKVTLIKKNFRYLNFFNSLPFEFFVTSENIVKLLEENTVKKSNIDILTIDIDSYDYYVAKEILKNNYKPKLLILEFNPNLPADKALTYPNTLDLSNKPLNKKVYGASYMAMSNLAESYGYKLVYITGICNLFYIRDDYANFFSSPNIQDEIAYSDEDVLKFVELYCQDGFVPSWLNEKKLTEDEINFFDEI